MRKLNKFSLIVLAISPALAIATTSSLSPKIEELTGDTRTACEVILCLSSAQGKGIAECQPPLRKYFSIHVSGKHWYRKTLEARRRFLDLCPAANEDSKMSALTTAIQNQEYACDAATLNDRTTTKYIWTRDEDGRRHRTKVIQVQNYLPSFCQTLYNHEYTEYFSAKPTYSCDPNKYYSVNDWNRGYETVVVSRTYNSKTEQYDVVTEDKPINKQCWK
ncbi:TrbM/KikA/MpfK family conjugal transfer protein [Lonepinella sp. BR2882]|uniref:TrbM/KikA/MpfK family conjugal transfer protein n=1 Tax=Lonepinella sp. BR2882 TaxID=3095283 RepID=UPI003F6DBEF1